MAIISRDEIHFKQVELQCVLSQKVCNSKLKIEFTQKIYHAPTETHFIQTFTVFA
jgi:hypothetical protein